MTAAQRLHIIHIAPCHVDIMREAGGVANLVRELALGSARVGHKVSLVCTNTELGKTVAESTPPTEQCGVTTYVVPQATNPLLGPSRRTLSNLRAAMQADPSLPMVAHVHTCFSSHTEAAMRLLKDSGIPYVFSPHGKLSINMFGNRRWAKTLWWRLRARRAVNGATMIGLTASNEAALFQDLSVAAPTCVIPNGFRTADVPVGLNVGLPQKYILYLGYLDPRKQPDFLIRAFAQSRTSQNHQLLLVGPDRYGIKHTLQELSDALHLSSKVVFWGAAYGAEKQLILRQAACICLPTLGEGHPLVLSEALGAGLPSVFSADANFPEVAAWGAGIQLDNFQPEAWAAAIDAIALDPIRSQAMKDSALRMACDYSWDAINQKWGEQYLACV